MWISGFSFEKEGEDLKTLCLHSHLPTIGWSEDAATSLCLTQEFFGPPQSAPD